MFRELRAPCEIGLLDFEEDKSRGGARKGLYASGLGRANIAGRRASRARTFIVAC